MWGVGARRRSASTIAIRERGRGDHVCTQPVPEDLAALAALADAGRLTVHIDRVLPPAEAVDALRRSQTGRGRRKIVLDIG
ncbi:zinc-binding dehydrogenase [Streptomyces violaceus]|uniref:zinc-binding dehydrogenase n=1 Tax=Streptomyces violaceus TaxID=1936 RepID=UPI001876E6F3|nr:hypothetical protein GCM10010270_79030 [Streptomyces janthinus]